MTWSAMQGRQQHVTYSTQMTGQGNYQRKAASALNI